MLEPSIPVASFGILNISSSCPASIATIADIIFVVLAIGILSLEFFSKIISPDSFSIRIALFALIA